MGNFYIITSIVINVLGQYLLKSGVNKLGHLSFGFDSLLKAFLTPLVLSGLFAYFISSIFWILALSQKDLSYAYPMLSLGYILVVAISWIGLNEQISAIRILGVIFISAGLFFVYKSA